MSNIIQLLERMGQDAELQTQANLEQAITEAKLSETLKASLLNRDDISLKRELDICPDVVAFLLPAEDEQDPKDEPQNDDPEQDKAVNQ
ncbi:hypothetical protein [Shewanella sp. Isolate11]|uniref:hypothetical protein n=1 Tax=Shewanella sp. Isolate11 TaxID=2908530 RepID=UPI001EFD1178|nr:hypothetical protein [Shewanella sp. Isolate11]MCG9697714.1 hypothetical protein [Shewanella sp. Isolate11]